ncbi:hypothetical protein ASE01_20110 [Nocardioides sp. Root190]|uniref:phage tail tape measure protein n=1 Tax=Nocardioides sp. Root190 TaxID=1736488 RepID=UPI0006FF59F1|nr:phage tail tape measure protein [Nocardioides sp. Root190]KRB73082.1 hypothetical protein ASE01_20110 [Nocardioides sp. Root190]
MAGPIRIAILANGRQARRETELVASAFEQLGSVVKGIGLGLLTGGIAGFAASAVDAERKFSTSMRLIQASTGASSEQIKLLNNEAVRLGQDTSFSAGEAADAMLELGKSGLSTAKIMAAVPEVMNLAATEGLDLAQAAGIVTSSLAQFRLRANQSSVVVNALAGASNASRSSVASLGESLKLVGSAGAGIGLSVNETAAALAALSDAGLDGSVAGTSLAAVFNRLVPQTDRARTAMSELGLNFVKSNGDFKNIVQIAGELQGALGKVRGEANRKTKISAIFGNDASTIAAVNALVNAGADGLKDYTQATKDQGAAQKLATARMSGTEGALERLAGSVETAKLRLGQELAPAVSAGADALDDKLVPAMEAGIKAGKDIARALVPAAKEITEALSNLAGEGDVVARVFDDVFLPALETTADAVAGLVNFVDELPGPIKDIGVQVGIAALVMPRLAAGFGLVQARATAAGVSMLTFGQKLAQNRAAMTYATGAIGKAQAALHGFGGAARSVAGIGGMLALSQGMSSTNDKTKVLMTTLGAAAFGFSVAGPWGGALVGAAGLLMSLKSATGSAEKAAKDSQTTWENYAATLDKVTAATTAATREMIAQDLQNSDLLKSAAEFGVSKQTLVDGILGEKKARGELTGILKDQRSAIEALKADPRANEQSLTGKAIQQEIADRKRLVKGIESETGELREATKATIELAAIANRIPEEVQTKITSNAVQSARDIANLAVSYKLTPKQIKTVLQLTGAEASVKKIQAIARRMTELAPEAKKEGAKAGKALSDGVGTAPKPNLAGFRGALSGQINTLVGTARTGGDRVGSNLGSGMYAGLGRWISPIAARSAGMVSAAIKSAQTAGQIQSPSRKTRYLGEMLGEGLAAGLRASQPRARTAGQQLMDSVLAGVVKGSAGVDAALSKITAQIEKSITGKKQTAREKALLKRYASQYKALRDNARAQDRVNARLEAARDKLKLLTEEYKDYAATIKTAITTTGDVTQLGRSDDGTVSITTLLTELKNKVANAQRFALLIQDLTKKGLSRASIQQMLDAGPEAALATAEAIASGGAAAITEINALQAQLALTGSQLGNAMADKYYGAGVQAAQGIVRGLEAEAKTLDAAAVRLANSLVAAVKKALGIRSPSRVFAGIGANVTKGLDEGIDDSYVQRVGRSAATSLQKGFGTPALDTYAKRAGFAQDQPIRVELRLTAEQIDRLSRGASLQADLDYARSNGVRGVTF